MECLFYLQKCKEVVRFKIPNWYKDWVIIHEDFLCKLWLCHLCHIKMKLLWSKTVVIDVHLSKAIEFIYIHCNMELSVPNLQIKCKSQNQKKRNSAVPRANEKKTKATTLPAADKNSKRFITKSFKCTCQPCFLRHFYTFVTFAIVCSTYLIIRNKTIFTLLVISFVVGYLSPSVSRCSYFIHKGILSVCRIVCVVVFHFFLYYLVDC